MKVYFSSNSAGNFVVNTNQSSTRSRFNFYQLNPAFLFLKTYHDIHGKAKDVNWLIPDLIIFDSINDTADRIVREQPDILGISVYSWNFEYQLELAKSVKQRLPNIVIVIGGPELVVHKLDIDDHANSVDFFKTYPFVDYAVYGDGEKPFQQIIDMVAGFEVDKQEWVNIVEPDTNRNRIIYPYEMLVDEVYMATPPYSSNRDYFIRVVEYLVQRGVGPEKQLWGIEFARGCMYSCSFCDWSSGLSKKVKRRTSNWKDEIDLMVELDVSIRETDANFGQWDEDLEIFDYCLSQYKKDTNFSFRVQNTPKLKIKSTEYIFRRYFELEYNTYYPKISIQDVHSDVLSAVNRPARPWSEIVEMMNRIRSIDPDKKLAMELIVGLPGQSFKHMLDMLVKLYIADIQVTIPYTWSSLPNSPGYDKNYQKMWGVKFLPMYKKAQFIPVDKYNFATIDEMYETVSSKENFHTYLKQIEVYETKHASFAEIITGYTMLSAMGTIFRLIKNNTELLEDKITEFVYNIGYALLQRVQADLDLHRPYIEKYGFVCWSFDYEEFQSDHKIKYLELTNNQETVIINT